MIKIFLEGIGCVTLQQLQTLLNTIQEETDSNKPLTWIVEFNNNGYGDSDMIVNQATDNLTTRIPFKLK